MPTTAFISLGPEYCVMYMNGNTAASKEIGLSKVSICEKSMQGFRAAAPKEGEVVK